MEAQELREFLAIVLYMGIMKLPDKRMYWGKHFGVRSHARL